MRPLCALLLCVALPVLGLVLSRVSLAGELELDVTAEVGYDSNVFRTARELSDVTYRFSPRMHVKGRELTLNYDVLYAPTFIGYLEYSDANQWNHRATLALSRPLGARTQLSVSDAFRRYASHLVDDLGDPGGDELNIGFSPRTTNDARLTLQHSLTERVRVDTTLTQGLTRYDEGRYSDWDNISGSLRITRAMSSRDTLGLGSSVSHRSFEDREIPEGSVLPSSFRTSSRTQYFYAFLFLQHNFNDDFTIILQGGPTWINSRRWSLSLPPQTRESQHDFTWFADAEIEKRWREVTTSVSYRRSEAPLGGTSRSALVDSVTLLGSWRPDAAWSMRLRGSWTRRTSRNPVSDVTDRDTVWSATFVVARRLTLRSSLQLLLLYRDQERGATSTAREYTEYSARLGFRYDFSTIRF